MKCRSLIECRRNADTESLTLYAHIKRYHPERLDMKNNIIYQLTRKGCTKKDIGL